MGEVEGVRRGGVCGRVSLNDDLKNRPVNKWSGSKQGSALHQKTPFICEQESLSFLLRRQRKEPTDADERTALV